MNVYTVYNNFIYCTIYKCYIYSFLIIYVFVNFHNACVENCDEFGSQNVDPDQS